MNYLFSRHLRARFSSVLTVLIILAQITSLLGATVTVQAHRLAPAVGADLATAKAWPATLDNQIGVMTPMLAQTTPTRKIIAIGDQGSSTTHTCVVTSAGGVMCWGYIGTEQFGDGQSGRNRLIPVAVVGLSNVVEVAAGHNFSCALSASGGVKCWGMQGDWALNSATPVDLAGLTSGVSSIAGSSRSLCALMTSGGVKCLGYNNSGQLGNGTTTDSATPVDVSGLTSGVQFITGGYDQFCAITTSGGAKCWGYNNIYGALGDGSLTNRTTPVNVSGLTSGVLDIAVTQTHGCAIVTGNTVKCWGYNGYGQLGDNTTTDHRTPADVLNLSGASHVAVKHNGSTSCASLSSGGVKCWGAANGGALGNLDATQADKKLPGAVYGLTSSISQIVGNGGIFCAVTDTGTPKCWGYDGQAGIGNGGLLAGQYFPIDTYGLANGLAIAAPDLTIGKSGPATATQGSNFSYTLVVTNTGTAATSGTVTVTDTLPAGLSFVSGSGFTCAASGQDVTCTSSTAIAINGTATINLTVNPTTTGVKSNTASVIGGGDTTSASSNTVNTTVNAANSAPVITSNGGAATASVNAAENQTTVTTVTASDSNGDPLVYSISGGADSAKFSINPSTGVLTFVTAPDFETPTDVGGNNVYDVQITVSDGNGGTDVQTIGVTVTDVAEVGPNVAPIITSNGGGATAAVNAAENQTAVTTVTATDSNGDTLSYSITGGADSAKFAINASSGVLTFVTAPDFETPTDADTNNSYVVDITVSDGNGGTDLQTLTATVTDVNEAAPLALCNSGPDNNGFNFVALADEDVANGKLGWPALGTADAAISTKTFVNVNGSGLDIKVTTFNETGTTPTNTIKFTRFGAGKGGGLTRTNATWQLTLEFFATGTTTPAPVMDLRYIVDDFEISGVTSEQVGNIMITPVSGAVQTATTLAQVNVVATYSGTPTFVANFLRGYYPTGAGVTPDKWVLFQPFAGTAYTKIDLDLRDGVGNPTINFCRVQGADYGDAPAAYGTPSHIIKSTSNIYLGSTTAADLEFGPQNLANGGADGTGDDAADTDDEDAFTTLPALSIVETSYTLSNIPLTNGAGAANLVGWIDFNRNGTFDAGEAATATVANGATSATLTWPGLSGLTAGTTYARLRLTTDNAIATGTAATSRSSGDALDGEVEDYPFAIIAAPTIAQPTTDPASISIPENTIAITDVNTTDDSGIEGNSTLTYTLSGPDAAKFTINANGNLTFVSAPDFEVPSDTDGNNVYAVIVTVTDITGLTDSVAIGVTVTDVAENVSPVITGGLTTTVNAAENQTAVTTVTATDGNAGDTLVYSISGGADSAKFAINATTGVLTFVAALDFETPTDVGGNNVYDVQVTVSDGNGGTDVQTIGVTVTDVAENVVLTLPVKVLLQGAYNQSGDLMRDNLRTLADFPLTSPYGGGETTTAPVLAVSGNDAIVDWVLVELRNSSVLTTVVTSQAALLQRDGDVVGINGTSPLTFTVPQSSYYVAVNHRNHLAVMTGTPLLLAASNATIDFTAMAENNSYGANSQAQVGARFALWMGDANGDNAVIAVGNGNDKTTMLAAVLTAPGNANHNHNYIVTGYNAADLNLNGGATAAGPENDIDYLYHAVGRHPANSTNAMNFTIYGQVP